MTHKHVQNAASGVGERVGAELARQLQQPLDPGLYLVATPIGNLGDMTLRAVATLARADLICCEDTRHSGVLLAHFGIDRPLRPYHEHNAAAERPRILAALAEQKIVALITDAGTPLISDPGFKLVRAATEQGFHVTALPGASAVLTALGLSGLPSDCFLFAGFLPAKEAARRSRLAELSRTPATLIFFEAPTRVAASLATIADVYPQRAVTVARELTKRFEDVRRGTAEALAAWAASGAEIKGEVVLVVAPPIAREVADDEIEAALQRALCDMKLRDAARQVADTLGVSRTRAYDIGLKLKAGAR
jgi:16S rRNA (cytidine1402-2'-O)-methyltransferase